MEISKLTEKDGKLSGGFTTLTLTQLKKVRGGMSEPGGDNCDCTNFKRCKINTVLNKKTDIFYAHIDRL